MCTDGFLVIQLLGNIYDTSNTQNQRIGAFTMGVKFPSSLLNKIWHYSEVPQTAVSLRQMCQFGSHPTPGLMFKASCFLLNELPVRLAHRIKELESLPRELNKVEEVITVRDWYTQSFQELYEFCHDESQNHGAIYQSLFYGSKTANVDSLAKMLFTQEEMETMKQAQNAKNSLYCKHKKFVDDGIVMKIPGPQSHTSNQPINTNGLVPLPQKYFSPLPASTVKEWSKSQDFYQFWPADLLLFNRSFYNVLQRIKERHDATVITLAKGVLKWKKTHQQNVVDDSIQSFLDRFYLSRIGIRMLIGQHLALLESARQPAQEPMDEDDENWVGIICTKTNITQLAKSAIDNARHICADHYGLYEAPKVQLLTFPLDYRPSTEGTTSCTNEAPDIEFMYVPGHLIHMLFETLKNSLRATVEKVIAKNKSKDRYDLTFPDIKVIITEGTEDLTVKISDEGGGIARSNMPLVWTYLYTTMPEDEQIGLMSEELSQNFRIPMAGYGYGLALSRLYARYFGGDLKLMSMEGFGTDVYLHLNRLSTSSEPLQ